MSEAGRKAVISEEASAALRDQIEQLKAQMATIAEQLGKALAAVGQGMNK